MEQETRKEMRFMIIVEMFLFEDIAAFHDLLPEQSWMAGAAGFEPAASNFEGWRPICHTNHES
jgi:hypothetical protein